MNELNQILAGLTQRTAAGSLKWKRTMASHEFVTSIDAISVVVRRLDEGSLTAIARYQLEILNDEGSTVEVLESNDVLGNIPDDRCATDEQALQLERLYVLARRSALNTQATLEKLAKALTT